MSLLINSQKIKEQLAKIDPIYNVTTFNLEPPFEMTYESPSVEVNGTLSGIPRDLERARERLLVLRQRIIDSGNKPLSPDELDSEIKEMRGR